MKFTKRIFYCLIAWAIVVSAVFALFTVRAEETKKEPSKTAVYNSADENSYYLYKQKNSDKPNGSDTVCVGMSTDGTVSDENGTACDSLALGTSGSAEYSFEILNGGVYNIEFTYLPLQNESGDFIFSLTVDGALPFTEAEEISLPLFYTDSAEKRYDDYGNQYSPEQTPYMNYFSKRLSDFKGVETEPYIFYLTPGIHTLKIDNLGSSYAVEEIRVLPLEEVKTYKEVSAHYKKDEKSDKVIVIEGEDAFLKSSRSLVPKADNTSLMLHPSNAEKQMINYIGLPNWTNPGEEIIWNFTVEKSGLYDLRFIYKQDKTVNGYSYRSLKIDGVTPFKEAKGIRFKYGTSWRSCSFSDKNDTPYLFYLNKGEHTLSLTATMSETVEYYNTLKDITSALGDLYLSIAMITGDTPDPNRDYDLFKQIDGLNDKLEDYKDRLTKLADNLREFYGGNNTTLISSIKNMARILNSMLENPYTAQNYINDYYNYYTTVCSSLYDMKSMPLGIDRIYFVPENSDYEIEKPGVLSSLWFSVKRFAVSFSNDYKGTGNKKNDALDIWVNWGRDQAMVLNSLIGESFTPETGIKVNLKLTNAGVIRGILSNNAPDLALHMPRTEPVNLAMRGALYDLTAFEDYSEVMQSFESTAAVPYTYKNGVYALPDTQGFYLMFYRTDVFETLELKVPETWDEFLKTAAVLQRNNMQAWIPYTQITTSTTVNTGLGGLNLFATFLGQSDTPLYNESLDECLLDSADALKAFTYWSRMYTKYKLPTVASFYNRFRIGTMPLGIEIYTQYTMFEQAAAEIEGRWAIATVPGTLNEDGTINNTVSGSGTGCGILSVSDKKDEAWEFLKWWVSADTQLRYNNNVESILGSISRTATANSEAFRNMVWDRKDLEILNRQRSLIRELPEVPGSYYVSRAVDQAFWSVINSDASPKDAIMEWSEIANSEIDRKILQYQ